MEIDERDTCNGDSILFTIHIKVDFSLHSTSDMLLRACCI